MRKKFEKQKKSPSRGPLSSQPSAPDRKPLGLAFRSSWETRLRACVNRECFYM
jgi:hypothetical protein